MHSAPRGRPPILRGAAILKTLQLGIDLQRIGKFTEAEFQYQSVLFNEPDNAEALNLLGTLAIEAKQFEQALSLMGRAVKLDAKNPVYHNNLGNVLLQTGELAGAKKHLNRAISLRRVFPEALSNLAQMHRQMLNGAESEKLYLRALRQNPDLEMALSGLAELLVDIGRPLEAEPYLKRVLMRNPEHVAALAGLAITRKFTSDTGEIDRLITRSEKPGTSDPEQGRLLHAAGKVANDLGKYDEAIALMRRAKLTENTHFPIDLHEENYRCFSKHFTAEFLRERSGFGNPTTRPVFIVGMPRSGTTLTEQICASHSRIYGAGELGAMRSIAAEIGFSDPDPMRFVEGMRDMSAADSRDLAAKYLKEIKGRNAHAQHVVDKMPHNYEFLPLIRLLFPNAALIHCARVPMDNCVSCYMLPFSTSHSYNISLTVLGKYYRAYHGLMRDWERALPDQILRMQYEDTVADIETRARMLIGHIGLDWEPGCLDFHRTERTVRTPSRSQVRQPIYASSVHRWKRYGDAVLPLQKALGDLA